MGHAMPSQVKKSKQHRLHRWYGKEGIGASTILSFRDDVKQGRAVASGPVEPVPTGAMHRCNATSAARK